MSDAGAPFLYLCTCWLEYVTSFTLGADYRSAPGELLPLDINQEVRLVTTAVS